jgi:hypothetical protein
MHNLFAGMPDGYFYEKRCAFYRAGDGYQGPEGFKSNPHFDGVTKELERSWAKISDWIAQGPYLLRQSGKAGERM